MLAVFFTSFTSIFLAEFGDKTQLISMNLACRYPPLQVLAGVMVGLAAVQAMAVGAGGVIYRYIPLEVIIIFSGAFFICIGLWTALVPVRSVDHATEKKSGFWPAVGLIFISELGDKTQITAMLLAASFGRPLVVLAGAILAMLANHLIAIFFGARFLSRLPDRWLRFISAAVFLVVGIAVLSLGARAQV
ncbi:MAG: TMEM165/GDT1 family protein [Firmicutes bacterium]|nr:TMEM165/GDT1 family protein [Bacillota bacterium]